MAGDVKQRPDSPGVWWREDTMGDIRGPSLVWHDGRRLMIQCSDGSHGPCDELPESRWIQADLTPPEFPQLPEKPKLVLAKIGEHGVADWWMSIQGGWTNGPGIACDDRLKDFHVIPHPDNDPEAVAAIERART